MNRGASDTQVALALDLISSAFINREPPSLLTDSMQLSDLEFEEVMSFHGKQWQDITFDLVERCADAVFWFSPEAFCYYLPGILSAGLRETRWDSNAYDAIIGCLDRSPKPEYWDDFFLPRWPLLSVEELDAVDVWVEWMESVQPNAFHENTYQRVRETLILLKRFVQDGKSPSMDFAKR